MRTALFVGLIFTGLLLFLAKRWISDNSLERLSNAFGVVALISAALVLVIPSPDLSTPDSNRVSSSTRTSEDPYPVSKVPAATEEPVFTLTFVNKLPRNKHIKVGHYGEIPLGELLEAKFTAGLHSVPISLRMSRETDWTFHEGLELDVRGDAVYECRENWRELSDIFRTGMKWPDGPICRLR